MGDIVHFTVCEDDLEIKVDSYLGYTHQTKNTTTFNRIDLVQANGSSPLSLSVLSGAPTCNYYTLTASYTTTSPVSSTAWLDEEDSVLLENSNTYISLTPGVFTFRVTHANGCVNSQTIET